MMMIGGTWLIIRTLSSNMLTNRSTYQEQGRDLVVLYCLQSGLELELGQDDDPVALINTSMGNENQTIDMAKGQESQCILRII